MCARCRQIAVNSHPDVQVLTVPAGKKDIGVDRVRELKRFMQLQPMLGNTKVAIIDDGHRLTIAAQNALLKTLEEPPTRSLSHPRIEQPGRVTADGTLALPAGPVRAVGNRFCRRPVDGAPLNGCNGGGELAALAEGSPGRALALSRALVEDRGKLFARACGVRECRICSARTHGP